MNNGQLNHFNQEEMSFRQRDLRGRSFQGQDLSGLDFSGADIRGANFKNAILKNANFAQAQAGLEQRKATIAAIGLLLSASLLGVLAGFVGATIGLQFYANALEIPAKAIALIVHVGFLGIALRKGITAGFNVFALALALSFAAALIHPAAIPVAGAIAIAIVIDFCVAAATLVASVLAILTRISIHVRLGWAVAAAFAIAFTVALWQTQTAASAVAIAWTVMILSAYVGWRTLRRQNSLRKLGGTLFSRWGTSFRGADLTGANFFQATLKNTDFRQATLTESQWNANPIDVIVNF
ncbi:MAG TPA: pentapeptide repeat-containing protein [Coleofasciculaceae cyanobacterium]